MGRPTLAPFSVCTNIWLFSELSQSYLGYQAGYPNILYKFTCKPRAVLALQGELLY